MKPYGCSTTTPTTANRKFTRAARKRARRENRLLIDEEMALLATEQAITIASQWYSVMTWQDPGVTMYAFASTGKVQSETHREQLLNYICKECKPGASRKDKGDLNALYQYIANAPIERVKTCQ